MDILHEDKPEDKSELFELDAFEMRKTLFELDLFNKFGIPSDRDGNVLLSTNIGRTVPSVIWLIRRYAHR